MEQEKKTHQKREAELREQIEELRKDNDRQQDLIGQVSLIYSIVTLLRTASSITINHTCNVFLI